LRTVLEGKLQGSWRTIPEALAGQGLRTIPEALAGQLSLSRFNKMVSL
jgi:hypothetical protein